MCYKDLSEPEKEEIGELPEWALDEIYDYFDEGFPNKDHPYFGITTSFLKQFVVLPQSQLAEASQFNEWKTIALCH